MMEQTIRLGQHGKEVELLQQLLSRAGQRVVVDGVYGRRTQAAVAAFLRERGQRSSGDIVGVDAMRQLKEFAQRDHRRGPPQARAQEHANKQKTRGSRSPPDDRSAASAKRGPIGVTQRVEAPVAAEAAEAEAAEAVETTEPPEVELVLPPLVPGLSPDTRHGTDLLGVQDEARAFARLICSRRTGTPLSIGLFGDWGSGKSFFMGKLQEEIEARNAAYTRLCTRLQDDDPARVATLQERWHGRVAQITFNAWHYAEPNLWASLVTRVFDELANLISPAESLEDTRARLLAEVSEGKQRREQAKLELRKAEEQLAEARTERDRRETELAKMREELAVVEAVAPSEKEKPSGPSGVREAEAEAALVKEQLRVGNPLSALRVTLRWVWTRGRWIRLSVVVAALLMVLGIVLAVAWWREWVNLEPEIAAVTTALGVGTGVVSTVSAWWAIIKPRLDQTSMAYSTYVAQRTTAEGFLHQALHDMLRPSQSALGVAQRRLEEAEVGLDSAKLASEEAADQVARARRMLQELSAGQRFYAFVRDRDEGDEYRKHLGLVSMIRQDFARLEEILAQVEREGPGDGEATPLTRIVLYIDDLDRCEPERVVEVLQAVHLLLATPIFVVVVAVDVRWLRRSLTLHYDRLLQVQRPGEPEHEHEHEARPTPKNYLEKIFQIPFSLRPMSAEGFGALVEGVIGAGGVSEPSAMESEADASDEPHPSEEPDANATEPADESDPMADRARDAELSHDVVLALDSAEVTFMKSLHAVIDTPRLAKALVNTYRLLRAEIEPHEIPAYLAERTYCGVLTLLAIQVGRSSDAAWLFNELERTDQRTLGETLQALGERTDSDRHQARWQALLTAVCDVGTAECTVAQLAPWTHRIRRFSFNPWPTH